MTSPPSVLRIVTELFVKNLQFISLHKSNKLYVRLCVHTINNGIGCPYVGISSCMCHRSLPLLFTCGRQTQLLTFFNKPFGLAFRHSWKPLFLLKLRNPSCVPVQYQTKAKFIPKATRLRLPLSLKTQPNLGAAF